MLLRPILLALLQACRRAALRAQLGRGVDLPCHRGSRVGLVSRGYPFGALACATWVHAFSFAGASVVLLVVAAIQFGALACATIHVQTGV